MSNQQKVTQAQQIKGGRTRTLHPTKGYRISGIGPLENTLLPMLLARAGIARIPGPQI